MDGWIFLLPPRFELDQPSNCIFTNDWKQWKARLESGCLLSFQFFPSDSRLDIEEFDGRRRRGGGAEGLERQRGRNEIAISPRPLLPWPSSNPLARRGGKVEWGVASPLIKIRETGGNERATFGLLLDAPLLRPPPPFVSSSTGRRWKKLYKREKQTDGEKKGWNRACNEGTKEITRVTAAEMINGRFVRSRIERKERKKIVVRKFRRIFSYGIFVGFETRQDSVSRGKISFLWINTAKRTIWILENSF